MKVAEFFRDRLPRHSKVRVTQRLLRTLIITFIAVTGLIACESGQNKAAQDMTAAGVAPRVDSSKLIFVVPVKGVDTSARLVLADAIAASLRDARKPAVLSEKANEMGPTIAGQIISAEERDSVVWVTALRELKAPYGTTVAEYRHQVVIDPRLWKTGSVEAINLLVSDAGPRIVRMVHDYVSPMAQVENMAESIPAAPPPAQGEISPASKHPVAEKSPIRAQKRAVAALPPAPEKTRPQPVSKKPPAKATKRQVLNKTLNKVLKKFPPAAKKKPASPAKRKKNPVLMPVPKEGPSRLVAEPPPASWGRPAFLIKPVKGAPGDGNQALTKAMKSALRKRDITVTEDPRQAGYVIEGRVEISNPVGGRQQAKIVWAVNTVAGEEIGKAVQENTVKAGSLNRTWGRVADIVTNAAVAGIQELFGAKKSRSSRTTGEPKFTAGPALPQVPGRAMPPP